MTNTQLQKYVWFVTSTQINKYYGRIWPIDVDGTFCDFLRGSSCYHHGLCKFNAINEPLSGGL